VKAHISVLVTLHNVGSFFFFNISIENLPTVFAGIIMAVSVVSVNVVTVLLIKFSCLTEKMFYWLKTCLFERIQCA
jgi:hypothetical protein